MVNRGHAWPSAQDWQGTKGTGRIVVGQREETKGMAGQQQGTEGTAGEGWGTEHTAGCWRRSGREARA